MDRYEIGERQTSACAAPTEWLTQLGLGAVDAHSDSASSSSTRRAGASAGSSRGSSRTFDYPRLCELLWEQSGDASFETAMVAGRTSRAREHVVHTDRGDLRAPLVVDALGWRRVLGSGERIQPPAAHLSRALEVHPAGVSEDLELWLDPRFVRAGYSWCFPAAGELRVGVGSFDPRAHVRDPTVRLAQERGLPPEGYQGNWIPHKMREAVEDGIFFVGDSAGHCLPATAEGIRPALYFGGRCGRELRDVLAGRQTRDQALARYAAAHDDRRFAWRWLLGVQRTIGLLNEHRAMTTLVRVVSSGNFVEWAMTRYLDICPPPGADAAPGGGAPVAGGTAIPA